MEFIQYNFAHDEWHNSSHALKKLLWSRNESTYLRQPISFGPMVGPRQDHYGQPIPSHDSRFTTHSIRFKTSLTYLQTLFPTSAFSFASPGTNAEATFQCTELDGLDWLGGGKYNIFGLWIHGVQYTKKDGSKLFGSFLPVLFESHSDPITTGREEIGLPKVFCDIDVTKGKKTTRVSCSWRGKTFVNFEIGSLKEVVGKGVNGPQNGISATHPKLPPGDGLLVYRYIPAVGKRGVADAEYPVFISKEFSTTSRSVERTFRASNSRVDIEGGDWKSLPTLHHIASALSEISVYNVIEAKREEGHGLEDLSQAERIE